MKEAKTYYKVYHYTYLDREKPTKVYKRECNYPLKGWFLSEEEALAHYAWSRKEAVEKLAKALEEIQAVQSRHGVEIGLNVEGDTYGIKREYVYVSVNVDGYIFERELK